MNPQDRQDNRPSVDGPNQIDLEAVEQMLSVVRTTTVPSDLKREIWDAMPLEGQAISDREGRASGWFGSLFGRRELHGRHEGGREIASVAPATGSRWWWRSDVIAFGTMVGLLLFGISLNLVVNRHNYHRLGADWASEVAGQRSGGVHLAVDSDRPSRPSSDGVVNDWGRRLGISSLNSFAILSTQRGLRGGLDVMRIPKRVQDAKTPASESQRRTGSGGAMMSRRRFYLLV